MTHVTLAAFWPVVVLLTKIGVPVSAFLTLVVQSWRRTSAPTKAAHPRWDHLVAALTALPWIDFLVLGRSVLGIVRPDLVLPPLVTQPPGALVIAGPTPP